MPKESADSSAEEITEPPQPVASSAESTPPSATSDWTNVVVGMLVGFNFLGLSASFGLIFALLPIYKNDESISEFSRKATVKVAVCAIIGAAIGACVTIWKSGNPTFRILAQQYLQPLQLTRKIMQMEAEEAIIWERDPVCS